MKFRRVSLAEAAGHILGHNVSHAGRRVLKKGRRLGPAELDELARTGNDPVYVAMLEPGDVQEDAAALRIASALAAPSGLQLKPAYGGRVGLCAPARGVLAVLPELLRELNLLPGVTLATAPSHAVMAAGQHVATLKVVPFALPEATLRAAEALAASGLLGFRALLPRRVSILVSGSESRRERLYESYRRALAGRVAELGEHSIRAAYVPVAVDPERELALAIEHELAQGADLLILVGETATMDADDLAPRAIGRAGGEVDVVGAPVFPGNLLLLGHRGQTNILGAPGCARSRDTNIVDLILPRLLLGERLSRHDIAALGHAGLLQNDFRDEPGSPSRASPASEPPPAPAFDAERARLDFPALEQRGEGPALVYLDSAATSQKPRCVIDAVSACYAQGVGGVNRGPHALGARASAAFDSARAAVQRLLGAASAEEIVFTSGSTAAINLVAYSYGEQHVGAGDEVLATPLEHHSNLLPWQRLCERKRARLRLLPLTAAGELDLDALDAHLTPRTRLVALAHVSNTVGGENPVQRVVERAARVGARVLVDGAQAVPRRPVNVRELGADFYVFSGHKLYAPSGIGVLYGKRELLERMPPFLSGGGMVDEVGPVSSSYAEVPRRFEAGSPNLEGAVGLERAIAYVQALGLEAIRQHDQALTAYARAALARTPGVRVLGAPESALGVVSFVVEGVHAHDVATVLDASGVAVRAGHHCASLALAHFGVQSSVRASFGLYNTRADVDALLAALGRVREVFAP